MQLTNWTTVTWKYWKFLPLHGKHVRELTHFHKVFCGILRCNAVYACMGSFLHTTNKEEYLRSTQYNMGSFLPHYMQRRVKKSKPFNFLFYHIIYF